MQYLGVEYQMKRAPKLDPTFIPFGVWRAAYLKGATGWETFWMITFPSVSPIIIVNVVYTIIDSFSSNDNVLLAYIHAATNKFDFATAAAMSWMYFVLIFIIIGVVYIALQKILIRD